MELFDLIKMKQIERNRAKSKNFFHQLEWRDLDLLSSNIKSISKKEIKEFDSTESLIYQYLLDKVKEIEISCNSRSETMPETIRDRVNILTNCFNGWRWRAWEKLEIPIENYEEERKKEYVLQLQEIALYIYDAYKKKNDELSLIFPVKDDRSLDMEGFANNLSDASTKSDCRKAANMIIRHSHVVDQMNGLESVLQKLRKYI